MELQTTASEEAEAEALQTMLRLSTNELAHRCLRRAERARAPHRALPCLRRLRVAQLVSGCAPERCWIHTVPRCPVSIPNQAVGPDCASGCLLLLKTSSYGAGARAQRGPPL